MGQRDRDLGLARDLGCLPVQLQPGRLAADDLDLLRRHPCPSALITASFAAKRRQVAARTARSCA
jgi:hypothetical protein